MNGEPFVAETVAEPSLPPLHETFDDVMLRLGRSFTVRDSVSVAVPQALVNVYVMVNVPVLETDGSKMLELTPVPEKAPPLGVP